MAQGYVPIQTITLTGTASSIDFVNIPQNYTDLKLLISSRNNDAGFFGNILLTINDSVSSYTNTFLQANGSSIGGGQVAQMIGDMNTSATTSNLFNNIEVYIPNYSGSTYKFFSADSIGENNGSQAYIMLMANTWAVTSAITKISLTNRNGGVSFVANTSVTLYGIGAHRASGGTITADSQYTYHTFTSSGTFTALEKIKNAEYLVIAGGGGGGSSSGGGGGAGGYRSSTGIAAGGGSLDNVISLTAGNSYSVIVGAGGAGGASSQKGVNGSNSMFANIVSTGGGAGSGTSGGQVGGNTGGSGGGGFSTSTNNGSGTFGQGYAGGGGSNSGDSAGGGGGAGSVGQTAPSGSVSGIGGAGIYNPSWATATNTGVNSYYAGGGGGGGANNVTAAVGTNGGGNGGSSGAGTAGTANTGSGGGGGYWSGSSASAAGAGGSGIVIIRYPN